MASIHLHTKEVKTLAEVSKLLEVCKGILFLDHVKQHHVRAWLFPSHKECWTAGRKLLVEMLVGRQLQGFADVNWMSLWVMGLHIDSTEHSGFMADLNNMLLLRKFTALLRHAA